LKYFEVNDRNSDGLMGIEQTLVFGKKKRTNLCLCGWTPAVRMGVQMVGATGTWVVVGMGFNDLIFFWLNYKLHPLSLVEVQFSPLSFDHFNLVL
jgi:hypothetical protein